jgi:hypothetical protein
MDETNPVTAITQADMIAKMKAAMANPSAEASPPSSTALPPSIFAPGPDGSQGYSASVVPEDFEDGPGAEEESIDGGVEVEVLIAEGENAFDYAQRAEPRLTDEEWLASLSVPSGSWLIDIPSGAGKVVACVRELDWYTAQTIEAQGFRRNEQEKIYFAGESERRETLRAAIVWVAETETRTEFGNIGGTILGRLSQDVVDRLWAEYWPVVELSAAEANALYMSANKYFRGEAQQGYPVPPIVVEVDFLLACGQMTRTELRAISKTDMERMQLVRMARRDALFPQRAANIPAAPQDEEADAADFPENFFPPGFGPNGKL